MKSDEAEIRELVQTWMAATKAGDTDIVLGLMTDDVVFLVPGREPMGKEGFAAAAAAQSAPSAPAIEGHSDIQEIQVLGEWAFMRTRLEVTATPFDGAAPTVREGHTLTILKKDQGRWRLARDANLLVAQPTASGSTAVRPQRPRSG